MKLAFCLFNYFPYGGLQRDFLRIAKACQERSHQIDVYTMRWEGEIPSGFQLHTLAVNGLQNHTRAVSFAEKLKAALQQITYDGVIGFNKMPHLDIYYAADVCYKARITSQRTGLYQLLPRYKHWLAMEKEVFAPGKSTEILLISHLEQYEFIRCYQTESHRFHLLPPGIAFNTQPPLKAAAARERLRASFAVTANEIVLLLIASRFKTKGLDRCLQALAAMPAALTDRCKLYVVGDDDPAQYQKYAKRLKVHDRVFFLGSRKDIPDILSAADILIHPPYHENTGTVLLEALVAGLPVLTLEHCGYAHYIKTARAGLVLPSPYDQNALNIALQKMVLSSDRSQWRRNGLAFAQTADLYSLPQKAADLIETIGHERGTLSSRRT